MASNFFRKMFGYKKKKTGLIAECTNLSELLDIEESLTTNLAGLEERIHEQHGLARKHGFSNKAGAKKAIIEKKKLEGKAEKVADLLGKIKGRREQLQLQSTELNTDILEAQGSGTGSSPTVAAANQNLDVVPIHDIIDSISGHLEACQGILDSISVSANAEGSLKELESDVLEAELDDSENKPKSVDEEGNSDSAVSNASKYDYGKPMKSLDEETLARIIESRQRIEDSESSDKLTPRGTNET